MPSGWSAVERGCSVKAAPSWFPGVVFFDCLGDTVVYGWWRGRVEGGYCVLRCSFLESDDCVGEELHDSHAAIDAAFSSWLEAGDYSAPPAGGRFMLDDECSRFAGLRLWCEEREPESAAG